MLPNPITFRANAPSPYVTNRRDFILDQMRRLGGPNYLDELENPLGAAQGRRARPHRSEEGLGRRAIVS